METVAFCEFDQHAQAILKKHWPEVPIHEDVRELDATQYRGTIDVVCGGFPCQDLSVAGKQVGFEGDRSSLYTEMLRIVSECRPRYAIFENVANLLSGDDGRWFAQFLYDLATIGYDAEWHCISASFLGACHHRDRVWVIAYPNSVDGWSESQFEVGEGRQARNQPSWSTGANATDSNDKRPQGRSKQSVQGVADLSLQLGRSIKNVTRLSYPTQPAFRGADDGIPSRLDRPRLARLGNAVVPQIPEAIGKAIMAHENKRRRPMSQSQQILQMLENGRTVTALDALNETKCMRLAARIHDLRLLGHNIKTKNIETASGKHVAGYYLEA